MRLDDCSKLAEHRRVAFTQNLGMHYKEVAWTFFMADNVAAAKHVPFSDTRFQGLFLSNLSLHCIVLHPSS